MGKARRKSDAQYKREAVRFREETGRPLREVAQELKVSEGALWRWRKQYGAGATESLEPSEAAELRRLRREVEILRQERDSGSRPERCAIPCAGPTIPIDNNP